MACMSTASASANMYERDCIVHFSLGVVIVIRGHVAAILEAKQTCFDVVLVHLCFEFEMLVLTARQRWVATLPHGWHC